jgi:hypothetical protein
VGFPAKAISFFSAEIPTFVEVAMRPGFLSLSPRNVFFHIVLLALLLAAGLSQGAKETGAPLPAAPSAPGGAGVHGTIYTEAPASGNSPARTVLVPDFEVFLVDSATGVQSGRVKTDLFGRYLFKRQDPGRYRLCWDLAGWVPGCGPYDISIASNTKYPPRTRVSPLVTKKHGAVIGRVRLGDGNTPWTYDPYFGIEVTAELSVSVAGSVAAAARSNALGDYVLTSVPRSTVTVDLRLENAGLSAGLTAASFNPASGLAVADLTLRNRPPTVGSVTVMVAGRGVRDADPGALAEVRAEVVDPDGDAVTLEWKTAPAAGEVSGSGALVQWQLPPGDGLQTLYLVASDRNGGYARKRVPVTATKAGVRFSGKVTTQDGTPLAGAAIEVNGAAVATSDAGGAFAALVDKASYYVVNVGRAGFADYSRIYDHGNVRDVYPLVRAQVQTVDPTRVIDVVDRREELVRNNMRGVRLILQPNSLVAEDGSAAVLPLINQSATLNLANGEMPGNFGAIAGGRETNLISFGAAYTLFTDSSGRHYNLRPGTTATIVLPVPDAMVATAPDQIVLWSYDAKTGLWDDSAGSAKLDRASRSYIGEVRHFSTINADIAYVDAACLKLTVDASVPLAELKAKISYVSGPTAFAQTPEILLDEVDNAMFRLPADDVVKIEILDAGGTAVISSAVILDLGLVPAPGGEIGIGPATTPHFPTPPYANCHPATVKLGIPDWAGFPGSAFLTFPGGGSLAETVGYYEEVNPGSSYDGVTETWSGGTRDTLGAWWAQAGFGPNGEDNGGIRAAYLNHNDLGFGRDMHIRNVGGDVYAYVTNYGAPDQNPINADNALAQDPGTRGATVCMENTVQPGVPGRVVKFFVYAGNGGGALAKLINSANLDGFGEKFVPNLCQNCHGGEFYAPVVPGSPSLLDVSLRANLVAPIGATFREFDIPAFRFPGGAVLPDPATEQALYDLNQLVKLSGPQPAITSLIDGWYLAAPPAQDNTWAPQEWKSIITGSPNTEPLYNDVVGRSCRTCHIGFGSDHNQGLSWNTYSQFEGHKGSIDYAVCTGKFMPHAIITYKNFWLSTSPNRPAALKTFTEPLWGAPIGTCE